jgi:DNA-directed RNA polymerase subunit H (RpoH/RPB5)
MTIYNNNRQLDERLGHLLSKNEKNLLIKFYNESNNNINKILVNDYISKNINAQVGDIICFTNSKNTKRYRLVV